MAPSSQQDVVGGLAKLPVDVLLNVFDDCDVADILNLALTCKELRTATEERHVWLTQFRRRCAAFRQAPFSSRTKELHVHSTAQLKSWTIQQAHTDALWLQHEGTGNNLKLQSVRINDPGHVRYWFTFLLPGGEYLVVVTHEDSILKKIERETDIGDSEWVLADVARRSSPGPEAECTGKVFTDTICEYPLIAYYDEEGASVTILRLDHNSQTISVQKEIRSSPHGKPGYYRMKYLSIRGDTILLLYWDPNKGFREHLVVAKLDDPDGTATRYFSGDRGTWGFLVSQFEILNANAFIRCNSGGIDLYHIPCPPPGTQSRGGDGPPTPSIIWSYSSHTLGYCGLYYDRTDAVLPNFYVHSAEYSHIIEFGIDTLADAKHDPCVGYPIVRNHTVTPTHAAGGNFAHSTGSRRLTLKGRKGVRFGYGSTGEEFCLSTVLVDDPNRRGHLRANLGQCGFPVVDADWVDMEFDEVTGRILLLVRESPSTRRLFFVDLPRS